MNHNASLTTLSLWILLMMAEPQAAFAGGGNRSNVRGMGMARTYTAVAGGIDAVGVNPANLALFDRGTTVTFSVAPMGFHVGNNFLDLETYSTYFTGVDTGGPKRVGKYLTEADKQDILNRFPSDGIGRIDMDYDLKLLSVSFRDASLGGFAFAVGERLSVNADMPRDYIKFILEGTVPGSVYSFQDTKVKAWWIREYSLSYAHLVPGISFLPSCSVGGSVKLLQGFGYFGIEKFDNVISSGDSTNFYTLTAALDMRILRSGTDILNPESNVSFTLFPAPVGSGFGFDVGIAADLDEVWSVGISVTDIGRINWKTNAIETVMDSVLTISNLSSEEQQDSLQNSMKGRDRAISGFVTPLPTALHVGLAFRVHRAFNSTSFPGTLLLALDYNQGFNDMPGNTMRPRLSVGAEYKPLPWLPIRTGLSFLGTDGINWAGGIGLNFSNFDIDLSTENFESVVAPNTARQLSVAFGLKLRI